MIKMQPKDNDDATMKIKKTKRKNKAKKGKKEEKEIFLYNR